MSSSRLPGKVMELIEDRPMLQHIIERLRAVDDLDDVIVATSTELEDEIIQEFCRKKNITCFAGSRDDVLDRFYNAATINNANCIVRITADCPLIESSLISKLLNLFFEGNYEYASIAAGAGSIHLDDGCYPNGLDAECFSYSALSTAWKEARSKDDREHVTSFLWRQPNRFRVGSLRSSEDYSLQRWTVDHQEDLSFVRQVFAALGPNGEHFGMDDVLALLKEQPELNKINAKWIGHEGYESLWDNNVDTGRQE